jgi:hypothetical protein
MRTIGVIVLVIALGGCGSAPLANSDCAIRCAKRGFVAGALAAIPADVACLPATLPLALLVGTRSGCHGVPVGPGLFVLGLPSWIVGAAGAVAVGAPALAVMLPLDVAQGTIAALAAPRPPRLAPWRPPDAVERDVRADQVMVDALADPERRDMMARQLASRRSAIPLLIRALDDAARGPAAARALAGHADLSLVREALANTAARADGDPATRQAARQALLGR